MAPDYSNEEVSHLLAAILEDDSTANKVVEAYVGAGLETKAARRKRKQYLKYGTCVVIAAGLAWLAFKRF